MIAAVCIAVAGVGAMVALVLTGLAAVAGDPLTFDVFDDDVTE